MRITVHHTWYQTADRHPAMNDAWVHAFNNWYDGSQATGNPSNTQICQNGKFYSENEILDLGGYGANPIINGTDYVCVIGGNTSSISCIGEYLLGGATCGAQNVASNFMPSSFYAYTPDPTGPSLITKLQTQTGWQNVTPPTSSLPAPPTNLRIVP